MTHDMIRSLSSEERAFFIENAIGDLFSFGYSEGIGGGNNEDGSNSSGAPPDGLVADGRGNRRPGGGRGGERDHGATMNRLWPPLRLPLRPQAP